MLSTTSEAPYRRRARVVLVAGLAGATCALAVGATPAPAASDGSARAPKVQRALDDVVAAGAPGAAVLIRNAGRTRRLSSGLGEIATRTPMRVAARTRIGGLTKTFVATVVLQLAGEGRLALDDTVERW